MRKTEGSNPSTPPGQSSQQNQSTMDEAQALFERMASEAVRQSEAEQARSQGRGAVARLLLVLTIAACLLAAATGLYGAYNFPDAPIRKTGSGYAGKGGKVHTAEEFESFILWRRAMFILFPSAFLFGFAFGITEAAQRRKQRS